MARQVPRSRYYDGRIYAALVDPLLGRLRSWIVRQVPENARVLDACCGTGALALTLAAKCSAVLGVDLSPRNIEYADRLRAQRRIANAAFEVGDVSCLERRTQNEFDVVTLVLALHEMPAEARVPVLQELARVGQRLIVLDYTVPMPFNLAGLRNRAIELSAGREHFGAFRGFSRMGGLGVLVAQAGLAIEAERRLDAGTLTMTALRQPDGSSPP